MTSDSNEWMDPDDQVQAAIKYLVENTDLSPFQAKEVVAIHGVDHDELLKIAKTMKAEG